MPISGPSYNYHGIGYIDRETSAQLNDLLTQGVPWLEAIHTIIPTAEVRQRYTATFLAERDNYIGTLCEFNTSEFLQGAITACQWLNLDWHRHIIDIHDGNTLVVIVNI